MKMDLSLNIGSFFSQTAAHTWWLQGKRESIVLFILWVRGNQPNLQKCSLRFNIRTNFPIWESSDAVKQVSWGCCGISVTGGL